MPDPDEMQDRLDDVEKEIEQQRDELDDELGLSDRHFIDSGDEEPVDDTIAPPG